MQKVWLLLFSCALMIGIPTSTIISFDEPKIKVKVEVESFDKEDDMLDVMVIVYTGALLEDIGIESTTGNGDWQLSINVTKVNGVYVVAPVYSPSHQWVNDIKVPEDDKVIYYYLGSAIFTGDNLYTLCQKLVSFFESGALDKKPKSR